MNALLSSLPARWTNVSRVGSRFHKSRKASVAVEFALLSPFVIVFMLTTIDYGVYFYVNSQFEDAVFQAQTAISAASTRPATLAAVKTMICQNVQLMNCSMPGYYVEIGPLTATQPGSGNPTADSYSVTVNSPDMIRVIYPLGNILPIAIFQQFGVPMTINNMEVGMFFYPTT